MASLLRRRALPLAAVTAAAGGAYLYHVSSRPAFPTEPRPQARRPPPPWTPPSRADMLQKLRQSSTSDGEEFDLLVIGGGATGAGVAVDAASRGLRVALVERDDFSSGTSSKSTKLVHGGVRYLQKAVFELDYEQYKLVREALHERKIFLQTAPYLSNMLPIMLPLYKYVWPRVICPCKKPALMTSWNLKILASTLLLVWLQNVRLLGWRREHGELVPHESRQSSRSFSHAQEQGSCRRSGVLRWLARVHSSSSSSTDI